jgi:hypothetical protein
LRTGPGQGNDERLLSEVFDNQFNGLRSWPQSPEISGTQ